MILIKNANLISMEEINYEICDILSKRTRRLLPQHSRWEMNCTK